MAKANKKVEKSFEWRDLFKGPRKWFVITPACVALIWGCWWGYRQVSTIPPPDASVAPLEEVQRFIGSPNGIGRLSPVQCEQYLAKTFQTYAQAPEAQRLQVIHTVERMTPAQKRVFGKAIAGVMKQRIMEASKTYNSLGSPAQQTAFARQFMSDLRRAQSQMIGGTGGGGGGQAGGGLNLGPALKEVTPTSPQEIQTTIYNNTTGYERAKAEPLIEKLAEVHREEINQKLHGG